ncbi:unnamed protein product [Periconia digitata]|uniref:Protein kinase domain-containing protein n=1 Tax=Periconia digitata TaxID=1303443 RepID=A0A9W4XM55_9PLEO|nr:unnamed protein product [Periconia digitata]
MIEDAFQRHRRPQFPTKAALLLGTLKSQGKEATEPVAQNLETLKQDPWHDAQRIGELVQGKQAWTVGVRRGAIIMIKSIKDTDTGKRLVSMLQPLSHPNIARVLDVAEFDDQTHFTFEYYRYTLEEVLCVHLPFEEIHIRTIVQSIFPAIKHIANAGIIHNAIPCTSIRVCGRSGKIVLADFEDCILQTTTLSPNIDLKLLGYTLLECMEGSTNKQLRSEEYILRQREVNKIFGVKDDRWSGAKLLVDFLDDLFNQQRPAIAKLDKEHSYVRQQQLAPTVLLPFTELVPLECFTLWRPAAK